MLVVVWAKYMSLIFLVLVAWSLERTPLISVIPIITYCKNKLGVLISKLNTALMEKLLKFRCNFSLRYKSEYIRAVECFGDFIYPCLPEIIV